jgi:hypothetical protein
MTVRPALAEAANEYRWLLDRGYADSAALRVVGDHHQLEKDERILLFRGVASGSASERRRALLVPSPRGRVLTIDGHNQAFTVMHYLLGKTLFIGSDGYLRDSGSAHGRIADPGLFFRSIAILADGIASSSPSRVVAYFDAPVSGSAAHAEALRSLLTARGIPAESSIHRSADAPLKARTGEILATSDSGILDGCAAEVTFDAARAAIEAAFGKPSWIDFGIVLGNMHSL